MRTNIVLLLLGGFHYSHWGIERWGPARSDSPPERIAARWCRAQIADLRPFMLATWPCCPCGYPIRPTTPDDDADCPVSKRKRLVTGAASSRSSVARQYAYAARLAGSATHNRTPTEPDCLNWLQVEKWGGEYRFFRNDGRFAFQRQPVMIPVAWWAVTRRLATT